MNPLSAIEAHKVRTKLHGICLAFSAFPQFPEMPAHLMLSLKVSSSQEGEPEIIEARPSSRPSINFSSTRITCVQSIPSPILARER
jgi:hypothetical protein